MGFRSRWELGCFEVAYYCTPQGRDFGPRLARKLTRTALPRARDLHLPYRSSGGYPAALGEDVMDAMPMLNIFGLRLTTKETGQPQPQRHENAPMI